MTRVTQKVTFVDNESPLFKIFTCQSRYYHPRPLSPTHVPKIGIVLYIHGVDETIGQSPPYSTAISVCSILLSHFFSFDLLLDLYS